jgi:hypothetical protein
LSTSSNVPLFGRRWDLTITPSDGSTPIYITSDTEPNTLKITFDIELIAYQAIFTGFISIYNLNPVNTQTLILQGSSVVLNAGYDVGSNYGNIFNGQVLRATFEKENVTDYKVTLQCVTGLETYITGMLNFASGPFQSQAQIIASMAANASTPFQTANVDSSLSNNQLPRPKVLFGQPKKYLEQISRDNNMTWLVGANGVSVGNFDFNGTPTPDVIYSATIPPGSNQTPNPGISYSILGTPQQLPQGIAVRVQLDARMQIKLPPLAVKIDNTIIRQLPIQIGQLPPVLSQDGIYAVAGVRHYGNSYLSNDWLTEIQCILTNSQLVALGLTSPNMNIRQANWLK